MVGHHHRQGLLLVGQLQAPGDGVVKGDGLVERHVRPAVVVSLVNAPAWAWRRERVRGGFWDQSVTWHAFISCAFGI